jgi:hypothetical protein
LRIKKNCEPAPPALMGRKISLSASRNDNESIGPGLLVRNDIWGGRWPET